MTDKQEGGMKRDYELMWNELKNTIDDENKQISEDLENDITLSNKRYRHIGEKTMVVLIQVEMLTLEKAAGINKKVSK